GHRHQPEDREDDKETASTGQEDRPGQAGIGVRKDGADDEQDGGNGRSETHHGGNAASHDLIIGRLGHSALRHRQNPQFRPKAFAVMGTASAKSTIVKTMRSEGPAALTRIFAPKIDPAKDPSTTSADNSMSRAPDSRYAAAAPQAVTPIMRFAVPEETLIGSLIAASIAGILSTPLPMPKRAESVPAPNINAAPSGSLVTW